MNIKDFISDSVLSIVGVSDTHLNDFVSALAHDSASPQELVKKLRDNGFPTNDETHIFANELMTMMPKKRKQLPVEEEDAQVAVDMPIEPKKIKKQFRRKAIDNNWAESEEEVVDEIQQDLKERDDFVERMNEKDAKKENEQVSVSMDDVRERSRKKYLKKREHQQLERLRREVESEENLSLTPSEREELDRKKRILHLARERNALEQHSDVYQLPEDYFNDEGKLDVKKRNDALKRNYKEDGKRIDDMETWTETKISAALKKEKKSKEKYDFVFDETQIEFKLADTINKRKNAVKEEEKKYLAEKKRVDTMKEMRESLPVFAYKQQLLDAICTYKCLIVVGETGSGKTTQIPQYLIDAGYTKNNKKIGCTQPRRVAAMSVAARVAQEAGYRLGEEIGYSIRFEDRTSERTILKYMTDGMLLREFLKESDLASYSVIIIDEAHERTLHTDVLFGLVKDIIRLRPELKLLISSATMDAQKFSKYFDDAPIFKIPGRPHPVDIYYTVAPEANYLQAAVTTVFQIHVSQDRGDILVFLTGQEEIESCQQSIEETCRALGKKIKELIVCPIYSSLPSELQQKIFEPTPLNALAETSITIDGIVYVIDPGFAKQKTYNPRTGMESLVVVPCSRASSNQRAGRAGRVGPGKCFRLYTQWAYFNELEENAVPEIQRTNLGNVVLLLKSLGVDDLLGFDFMDAPPRETLMRALEQLYALGALNNQGILTKLGRKMAEFPVDPMMSKAIISAEKFGCSDEIVSICSMLSVQNTIFYRPKDKIVQADRAHKQFEIAEGDHLTLLEIWNRWSETGYSTHWCFENFLQSRSLKRAKNVRDQLLRLLERVEVPLLSSADNKIILKALTSGFFYNTAKISRTGDSYLTIKKGHPVYVHPASTLAPREKEEKVFPRFVIYFELLLTTKEYMRVVSGIEGEWLLEIAPHYFKQAEFDESRKMPRGQGKKSEFQ